jgi:hypothetical protein
LLQDALDAIPEATPEKEQRLREMSAAENKDDLPESYSAQMRWIGRLPYSAKVSSK